MSGLGRDGALGARAIKNAGGRVLVQDRTSCASFEMPRAAIETGSADFVLPLEDLASALIALVTVPGAADLFRVTPGFSLANAYRYLQREGGAPARLVMKPGMAL
ncbi:MAG TPA: chemotaxis protein CheB [Nitrospiraceae bacterium]|nr:chemotaxis protein CheB [Nitrospiraceae bacterium]